MSDPIVRCEGSPYHKRHRTRWGAPIVRSDKTPCPTKIDSNEVSRVLEEAIPQSIARGWCCALRDGDWPRYVWGRSSFRTTESTEASSVAIEIVWEARVQNHGVPVYKAYPCSLDRHADHMPFEVEEALWP